MIRAWKTAAAAVLLALPALAMADDTTDATPDATLMFSARTVAVGVGVTWGKGTLYYGDKSYSFTLDGLGILNIGANEISGVGEVYHLSNLQDFNGTYGAVAAGFAVSGGEASAALENQNGVVVRLRSDTQGLQLNAAVEGVTLTLADN